MSISLPRTVPDPSDDERRAMGRLERVRGPGGMRAALLALLVSPGHAARLRAWREETVLVSDAEEIRADIEALAPPSRLPWFELLLARLGGTPLAERQALLRSARRVLAPPGHPLDRLLLLAMRRHFGDHAVGLVQAAPDAEISRFPPSDMLHIQRYTAHLARMVPADDAEEGLRWYQAVMTRWLKPTDIPPWEKPDVDALVHALNGLQAMSWIQRPQIVRAWVVCAFPPGRPGPLAPAAADALRLSCLLLDSPLPPELARQYVEVSLH